MSKYRAIILLGPPGSGKGTVGKIVANAGEQVHISTGDMFRALDHASGIGKEVKGYLDAGKLVPDELTVRVWRAYVHSLIEEGRYDASSQVLVLDGIPRSAEQVELLKPYVDVVSVVVLEIPNKEVLIERLQLRGQVEGRSDDQKREVVEHRLQVYERQTAEVVGHYPKELIYTVNGDQTRLKVLRDVLAGVADLI